VDGPVVSVSAEGSNWSIDGRARFLFSGEFHYFRVDRADWADRLRTCRQLGLDTVSIYVPWNWHHLDPREEADLRGRSSQERDLAAALDEIASADLDCIFRPGPFITAEWRGGGIPDWLWERDPSLLALDATGGISLPGHPYPGITSSHPVYREEERRWLESVAEVALPYLASRGGPIVDVQLDDEPSYWQRLAAGPLVADYNPFLIAPRSGGQPSRFAEWILGRFGSLAAVNEAYGTTWSSDVDVQPPGDEMESLRELPRFGDWFDFKVAEVNEDSAFQHEVLTKAGVDVPISMLFPYLLPLTATRYTDFIEERGLPIHLTNECYLSLFGPNSCPEQKVGDIVATHETYHMWRRGHGPAITMELQGSNSTYITPGAMELLYAVTVARGIKGVNFFMMVGGRNPAGFENVTGRGYDISAPIAADGTTRPHADVIGKLFRLVETGGPSLLAAEPLRDTWIGCWVPYERAAIVGGTGPLGQLADVLATTWNGGDMGLSDAASLPALMTLGSVSFGCLDLDRATDEELSALPQLWTPGLSFLGREVQRKLLRYVEGGGHLLMLPSCPESDEQGKPCTDLWDAVMSGVRVNAPDPRLSSDAMAMLDTPEGEGLVAPGGVTTFDLPEGVEPLVRTVPWGDSCAFTRSIGDGRVTILGFRLQYVPNEQEDQFAFLERLVTDAGARPLRTRASDPPFVAMQLNSATAGFVCLVNPVDLPGRTSFDYTVPGSEERASVPQMMGSIEFERRGARLLPLELPVGEGVVISHSTWELVGAGNSPHRTDLTFDTRPGEIGEIGLRLDGHLLGISNGTIERERTDGSTLLLVVRATAEWCNLSLETSRPAGN
jgi:beta-galactosidase